MEENKRISSNDDGNACSQHDRLLAADCPIGEYRIIKTLSRNGEGATYLAKDSIIGDMVEIREFFPRNLARRCADGVTVEPVPCSATKFKYFRASFMDLYRTLAQAKDNECLLPIIQVLEQNATVYAVSEHRELTTLEERLCGGRENWCSAKKYLLPLYNALSNLHKRGIIHQGICPKNILLDQSGNPYLTGFSLLEACSLQGELDAELFAGYSAPEQYKTECWIGTETDVYAMAAVTYRVLTGIVPQSAKERLQEDKLRLASEIDEDIAENLSEALWEAMKLDPKKRYENMDTLTGKMLETVSSNTAVFRVEDTGNQTTVHLDTTQEKTAVKSNRVYTVVTMVVVLMVLVVGVPGMYRYFGDTWEAFSRDFSWDNVNNDSQNQNPEQETTQSAPKQEETHKVENFVGRKASDVLSDSKYEQWYRFETVEQYNEEFEEGIIFSQTLSSGTQLERKSGMTLYVSKGSENEPLPQLVGKKADEAIKLLESMGKQYKIIEGENTSVLSGEVFRTDPPEGTPLKKNGSDTVLLYVAVEKAPEPEPEKKDDDDVQIVSQKNSDKKVIKKKSNTK